MASLSSQVSSLERAKKNYEKAFKEAERACDGFQRADADLNLSRAEVEKQRTNMSIKSQHCEESKTEYANQLQKTNELQVSERRPRCGVDQRPKIVEQKCIHRFGLL